ncbi:MAG: hypothetical protein KatS3mg111_1035 [Pirellulaceae bacterium]|nr:MAG: hypothetical protein KatS3mg111_1035 [Pirellulaceae bacterium]
MKDLNPVDNYLHGSWEALGNAAPVLVALAQLCSERWVRPPQIADEELLLTLGGEAKAILYAARDRGTIELKAVNSAFDAAARLLAVYVELSDEQTIAFRDPHEPSVTVQFLEGFKQLCEYGLIMHHIYRDFSLAPRALVLAQTIAHEEVSQLLEKATEFGIHD